MSIRKSLIASAVFAVFAITGAAAYADDHAFSEGHVVNITKIRTADGKFDEYMKWVDGPWKKYQELGMKTGDVISYQVLAVEARSPDDPDLLLIVTYKNWATQDGATAKGDALAKQLEGSVAAASQSTADRASIRRVLGSYTTQELVLK